LTETWRHVPFFPYKPTEVPDPRVIIEQFKQAAINAKAAGFDGVERKCFTWKLGSVLFIIV
jgi:hypothetical protein